MTPGSSGHERRLTSEEPALAGNGGSGSIEQIKLLYTLFLGLLLATAIGVGIAAFYAAPSPPRPPEFIDSQEGKIEPDEARRHEVEFKRYEAQSETYNRNVSIIAVAFAVVLLAISMAGLKNVPIIANGLMLGGVFTLIYGIARSFGSGEQKFMFVIVLVGIVATLALGYARLIKPAEQRS